MLERMIQLLKDNHTCVLATCSGNRPHCSLMAYVADDHARVVYMITQRGSRKHTNMLENPMVSFLVDTRQGGELSGPRRVLALTVHGTYSVLKDATESAIALKRILETHPQLEELASSHDAEVFSIKVASFLLLDGPADAYYHEL